MPETKICLDSCVSFSQLNKSQTNFSKSKQAYSFSKSNRFKQYRPQCNKTAYDNTNYFKKSLAAGIGYGQKYDFTKQNDITPSPDIYRIKTQFEEDLKYHRGPSFTLGRQKIVANNYFHTEQCNYPSSSNYCVQKYFKSLKNKEPAYSLRKKTKTIFSMLPNEEEQFNKPGPGAYNNPQLITKNKHFKLSKFTSVSFSTGKAKRFKTSETITPGPGKYKQALRQGDKYSNSKFRNSGKVRFSNSKRNTYIDDQIQQSKNRPGPGNYRTPSQFGIYDGNVANYSAIINLPKKLLSRPQTSK